MEPANIPHDKEAARTCRIMWNNCGTCVPHDERCKSCEIWWYAVL